jgi:hypothetical protein
VAIKGEENSAFDKENDGSGYESKSPKTRAPGKNNTPNYFEMSPIEVDKDSIDGVENEAFEKEAHPSEPISKNEQEMPKDIPRSLKAHSNNYDEEMGKI